MFQAGILFSARRSAHTIVLARDLKVVNMGTAISETKLMDKWAASKRTQVSQQYFASNCSLCLIMP